MARLRRPPAPTRAPWCSSEAVLAVAAAAVAVQSVGGYVVAGLAVLIGLVVAGPPPGPRAARRAAGPVARSGTGPDGPAASAEPGPSWAWPPACCPGLQVTEVATRDGPGWAWSATVTGFAVLLSAGPPARPRTWDLAELVRVLTDDPARPAAVQLLVEQGGPGRAGSIRTSRRAAPTARCRCAGCRCGTGCCW